MCRKLLTLDPEDEAARRAFPEVESVLVTREADALVGEALTLAADGDIEAAERLAEKVERLAPWSPRYLQLQVYLDEEAARHRAADVMKAARAYLASGRAEEARAAAEEALGILPGYEAAVQLLDALDQLVSPSGASEPAATGPEAGPPATLPDIEVTDPSETPALAAEPAPTPEGAPAERVSAEAPTAAAGSDEAPEATATPREASPVPAPPAAPASPPGSPSRKTRAEEAHRRRAPALRGQRPRAGPRGRRSGPAPRPGQPAGSGSSRGSFASSAEKPRIIDSRSQGGLDAGCPCRGGGGCRAAFRLVRVRPGPR